jgi:DHA2 family multidrug resistance protein
LLAFVTLSPSMRTEGASLFSLLRNLGAAIGVSIFSSLLAHNSQAMHEMIGASVTPFNRALQTVGAPGGPAGGNAHRWLDPATPHGAAMLDSMVNRQAQIVAYADDYVMLILTTLPALPLLLLMRLPRKAIATPSE